MESSKYGPSVRTPGAPYRSAGVTSRMVPVIDNLSRARQWDQGLIGGLRTDLDRAVRRQDFAVANACGGVGSNWSQFRTAAQCAGCRQFTREDAVSLVRLLQLVLGKRRIQAFLNVDQEDALHIEPSNG